MIVELAVALILGATVGWMAHGVASDVRTRSRALGDLSLSRRDQEVARWN